MIRNYSHTLQTSKTPKVTIHQEENESKATSSVLLIKTSATPEGHKVLGNKTKPKHRTRANNGGNNKQRTKNNRTTALECTANQATAVGAGRKGGGALVHSTSNKLLPQILPLFKQKTAQPVHRSPNNSNSSSKRINLRTMTKLRKGPSIHRQSEPTKTST